MNRDALLQILGQLDTDSLLRALAVNGIDASLIGGMGAEGMPEDPELSALQSEPIKGWGERKITRGADDRPTLSDKKFIEINAQKPVGGGLPADSGFDPAGYGQR